MTEEKKVWIDFMETVFAVFETAGRSLWISRDGNLGYNGTIKKHADHIYSITQKKGGAYFFCSFDIQVFFDPHARQEEAAIGELTKGAQN